MLGRIIVGSFPLGSFIPYRQIRGELVNLRSGIIRIVRLQSELTKQVELKSSIIKQKL